MKVSLIKFLFFQRRTIGIYIFTMVFITIMLFVEPNMQLHYSNIIYILLISSLLFLLYLTIEYFYVKRHFNRLQLHSKDGFFIEDGMEKPKTYEQFLFRTFLNYMNEQYQEKMTAVVQEKSETLEYMTKWFHEIKTPIAISRLEIERAPKIDAIKSIDEEINKIDGYVEQALYYIRSGDFHSDYFITHVDLDQLIRDLVKKNAKVFIRKKIKLIYDDIEKEVMTDQKWLDYVLSQILSNALKYTPEKGQITIRFEEDSKELRLIINDNGIGIEEADLLRVFEKGFTGKNGRIFGASTGMGLYLANKLAKRLGHTLTVDSKENEFTTVIIHFSKMHDYYEVIE